MGIPYLQRLLKPYATSIAFGGSRSQDHDDEESNQVPPHSLIIDGPALAYHALAIAAARLRSRKTRASTIGRAHDAKAGVYHQNALLVARSAIPSYEAISSAMFAWLREMQHHGVGIECILFDGGLPYWKTPIRLERIQRMIKELEECYCAFPEVQARTNGQAEQAQRFLDAVDHDNQNEAISLPELFDFHLPPTRAIKFPRPPCFVSAMLEILRRSEYSDRTQLVPGEADAFCSSYVCERRDCVIVTSDSDLLISDLGLHGSVMLFYEFGFGQDHGTSCITGRIYSPSSMSKRFQLTSLLSLGYVMKCQPRRNITDVIRHARALEKSPCEGYKAFVSQYPVLGLDHVEFLRNPVLRKAFQEIDISSELVTQFFGLEAAPVESSVWKAYPVFLLEDVRQASALNHGLLVRQLAYSLLAYVAPREITSVTEYYRKANRVAGSKLGVLSHEETEGTMKQLQVTLCSAIRGLAPLQRRPCWRDLALVWLVEALRDGSQSTPSRSMLNQVYSGHVSHSWDLMHLSSQLQAVMYSWRLLVQCAKMHLSISSALSSEPCPGSDGLLELADSVDHHGIADMFDIIPYTTATSSYLNALIDTVFGQLKITEDIPAKYANKQDKNMKMKMKMKQRNYQRACAQQEEPAKKVVNMFESLSLCD